MDGALLLLLAAGACAGLWNWGVTGRERALREIGVICKDMGLQALDESVVLNLVRLRRGPGGKLRLVRVYRFDFTLDGHSRHHGDVALAGLKPLWARLYSPAGDTWLDLDRPATVSSIR